MNKNTAIVEIIYTGVRHT